MNFLKLKIKNPKSPAGNPGSPLRDLKLKRGFTLIEVVVSIFVLSIALSAISFIFSSVIASANTVKHNFIASFLAQEGIEVMNNLRNGDWIAGRPFGSFGTAGVLGNGSYRVQWDSAVPITIVTNPPLLYDSTTGLYGYSSGTASGFTREIVVDTVIPNIQIRITANVSWTDSRGNVRNLAAESHLYNWK